MKTRMVCVFWRDAHFEFDLKKLDDLREDYIVRTYGVVIHEDETFLTVAQEVLPDDDGWRGVTRIPKVNVVREAVLNESR